MSKAGFLFLYLMIAVIVFIYARKAAKNPKKQGKYMARNLYLSCGIVLFYCVTLASNNYFVMSVGNTGVLFLMDWLIFFSLEYVYLFTKQKKDYSFIKKILMIFLAADSLTLLINPFYEISVKYELIHHKQDAFLIYKPLPPYYIHLTLCYLMFLFILIMLIGKAYRIPKAYRTKYLVLYLSLIGAVGINAVFYFIGSHIDISIIFYVLVSCLVYFISFDYKPNSLLNNMREIIVEGMNNPVVLFDFEGKLVTCNLQATKVFSLTERDEGEKSMKSFMDENNFSDVIKIPKRSQFDTKIEKNGKQYWFDVNYSNLTDNKARYLGGLFVFTDITEQKKVQFELEYLADHDPMTGCYNQNYFLKVYDTYEKMRNLGVILWSVNSLKLINDFYGKSIGDRAICKVAECIKARLRTEDVFIRLEGEGLLILMPSTNEKAAGDIMEDIRTSIFEDKTSQLEISAEFGVAIKETENKKIEDCLIQARNIMNQKKMQNDSTIRNSIIESLKRSLSESDYETQEHAERTKNMALKLGEKIQLSEWEKEELALLSVLHDIGKIAIPDRILLKPDKLTEEEWEIMKSHAAKGFEIAKVTSELEAIAGYILHHHERWDGAGYPSGLSGEEIPLLSRIITVVDSHDVMTHDRPYHKAMSKEEAKEELTRCAGSQFDPKLVKAFLEMLEEEE